ncbi:hypothetical protein CU097_006919 [Rhizopus azygosporus]|uniref:Uncharacterized protein n=1 Tax=Rhizopus azygosporus TaxID=86630 RepID=A0A367J4V9_RHIAZ|nr:hypothetical protein CU097_006919 [Rhizopus azygosporus]
MQQPVARSPFYNAVQHLEFQPLNDDMIQLLYGDWCFKLCLCFPAVDFRHALEHFSVAHISPSNIDLWVKKVTNDNTQKGMIWTEEINK